MSKPVDAFPAWKRGLDLIALVASAPLAIPVILLSCAVVRLETGRSGLYRQERVGAGGRIFTIVKIRTMYPDAEGGGPVTVADDPRVTRCGRLLRRLKFDELPQLWNVLKGDMTLVGPRPDVPGFADRLEGTDRIVLTLRPGLTGPASIAFRDEEALLAEAADPQRFNAKVLFPAKVRLNRAYAEERSFLLDVRLLAETLFPPLAGKRVRDGMHLLDRLRQENEE